MNKSKIQKWIIALIILLIIAIISCTVIIVSTLKNNKVASATKENQTEENRKEKKESKATPTPTAAPTYTLNEMGSALVKNIASAELINCVNSTSSSCERACDNSNPVILEKGTKLEEIVSHLQTGKALSELPKTGDPMESCGGAAMTLYYNDGTYSRIWFGTRNYMIINEKAPTTGGNWQKISYYYFETEDLYQYLVAQFNALKSSN
ncbi:MAG: hypothetical protein PHN72_06525 [Bacilli bacterium]|nr:hypothetical protein [Bacilli bacterium]